MHLAMNPASSLQYTSRSQMARVVTEEWAAEQLYCAACASDNLSRTPCNTRAIDLACKDCNAPYQLKSSRRWNEGRVADAGYDAMIAAIRSDRCPNLFVLHYDQRWMVQNLILIPWFFFSSSAIQKRKPLAAT